MEEGPHPDPCRLGLAGLRNELDGLTWERFEANPAVELTFENGWLWMGGVEVEGEYNLYFAIQAGRHGIGLITGTVTER